VEETIRGAMFCMLSGRSHGEEVARNIPSALVAASKDINISLKVQDYFMNKFIRIYTNSS
ncbi:glycerol-3-phosphate dehydrogenase, partial [Peptostreptococcus anaerobius]|nr:glycerol-3-phosphate dehydrogenase [Peptostreptococcus anaerobius]